MVKDQFREDKTLLIHSGKVTFYSSPGRRRLEYRCITKNTKKKVINIWYVIILIIHRDTYIKKCFADLSAIKKHLLKCNKCINKNFYNNYRLEYEVN